MEATCHSETSIDFQTIARRYISKDRTLHLVLVYKFIFTTHNNVMNLSKALPGNSSVNTVQHATVEGAVFSVDFVDTSIYRWIRGTYPPPSYWFPACMLTSLPNNFFFLNLHSRGWSPNWVHSARRPFTGLLYLPRVIVRMENLVE
jgi:hypothetical protein